MIFRNVPFEDVFADESGGNIKTPQSEYQSSGRFPVVDQGKALIAGYVDDEECLCGNSRPAIVFGDHTRCVKYVEFPFCMGADGVKVLRPKIEANLKYLYYYLKQVRLPDAGYDRHYKYLKRIEVVLPPLSEQIRIVAVLDQVDALRVMRKEALAQLDGLTKSVFIEMFGDTVANPKGWSKKVVGELLENAEVFVDGDWVESKDQDPEGEVRLIQLADIGDGCFINKSARFLNKPTATRLKCTVLKKGDILIARMPDPLGRACLFPGDQKECVTVVDVCIIRTKNNEPDHTWFMYCINSHAFRSEMAGEATGATRVRISRGNLSRLEVIAPPLNLQRDFSRRVSAVEKIKESHIASLAELDNLFASLQHRAFRGEL